MRCVMQSAVVVVLALPLLCMGAVHKDLLHTPTACYPHDSCKGKEHTKDWERRNCFCDDDCSAYGDCCWDAPALGGMRRVEDFQCIPVPALKQSYYMKTTCPSDWLDSHGKRLCERRHTSSDPVASLPVTSLGSRVTYANYYCALCNENLRESYMTFWQLQLDCSDLSGSANVTADVIGKCKKRHVFERDEWEIKTRDGQHVTCKIHPVVPASVLGAVRPCLESIGTCHANWTDADVSSLCHSYTSHVYYSEILFRNPHCAACNYVSTNFSCPSRRLYPISSAPLQSERDLLLQPQSNAGRGGLACLPWQLHDPFLGSCRGMCGLPTWVYRSGQCLPWSQGLSHHFQTCPKISLSPQEYRLEDAGMIACVPDHDLCYPLGDFALQKGMLVVCEAHTSDDQADYQAYVLWPMGVACMGVSISAICVHLVLFAVIPRLRGLLGYNVAAMSLSLLVAHTCFLGVLGSSDTCIVWAVLMYYSLVATTLWTFILSLDEWLLGRGKNGDEGAVVARRRSCLCITVYSVVGWVVPAITTLLVLLVVDESEGPVSSPGLLGLLRTSRLSSDFAFRLCWFSSHSRFLFSYVVPVGFLVGCQVLLAMASARRGGDGGKRKRGPRLRACFVTNFLSAASWLALSLGFLLDLTGFLYAFLLLGCFQGLFILLGLTLAEMARLMHVKKQALQAV